MSIGNCLAARSIWRAPLLTLAVNPPQTVDAGAACANKQVIWFCSLGAFGTAGVGHPSTESFSQLRCVSGALNPSSALLLLTPVEMKKEMEMLQNEGKELK